ncbi:polyprenyl synthetase family protein [Mycobacterium spongiae]|uniref:Polyprenyl synthetase family protein n=2 Tax=Mycobacterium spongiae TaxID=886343 RepID=A0A975K513_9MYCO|nr:polyprenyl synthetase family protein [Mycobacterium spongiae]
MSFLTKGRLCDPEFVTTVRNDLARIAELIRHEIDQSEEMFHAMVNHSDTPGTRLRPVLTVLAAHFGAHPGAWQVTVAGAALELMHLAAHDHNRVADVPMTCSNTSRPSNRNSNNLAILAGDHAFAIASRLSSRLGTDAYRTIADTFTEMVTGQMRETCGPARHADALEHRLRVVHEKTGSITAAAGQLGATFAGATENEISRLSRVGRLVGTAFEVSDDILAIAGDHNEYNMQPSEYLPRGVESVPVLCALREQGPDANRLRELLADPVDGHHAAEAITLLRSSSGIDDAKNVVAGVAAQAREELASLPDCTARRAISTLIDASISRHR